MMAPLSIPQNMCFYTCTCQLCQFSAMFALVMFGAVQECILRVLGNQIFDAKKCWSSRIGPDLIAPGFQVALPLIAKSGTLTADPSPNFMPLSLGVIVEDALKRCLRKIY
jgi:hypothetical protein